MWNKSCCATRLVLAFVFQSRMYLRHCSSCSFENQCVRDSRDSELEAEEAVASVSIPMGVRPRTAPSSMISSKI
jgi:hypothetical protein